MNREELAKSIDHTLLKPDASSKQIEKLCSEAKQYGFASVCVNPCWVPLCSEMLKGSQVKVCTVIGFPLGSTSTESKAAEAEIAVRQGADELDMVINVGRLLEGDDAFVLKDIQAVVHAAQGRAVKVIIEICYLNDAKIIRACQLSKEAGAEFVKTSTGFGTGGATEDAVKLMRNTVGPGMGIKAAGGIRNRQDALKMINAGATRIGASAGIAIVEAS